MGHAVNYAYDIARGDWEEPGRTIAEHTSSPPLDWSKITNVTLHFPGTNDPIPAESATRSAFISNLRNSQRYYIDARGYSYGYNAAVWGPLTAEIRGEGFRCAANGNTSTNTPSFAIQVRSGGSQQTARPASADEIESIRTLVAWCERRAGRTLTILGHRDHKSTGCPGDAIYAQIQSGVFRPATEPASTPDPTPDPPTEELMRFVQLKDDAAVYIISGLTARWVRNGAELVDLADRFGISATPNTISDRSALKAYTLLGHQPQYPGHASTVTTSAADFAGAS